jgi:hypothetical protein
MKKTLYLHQIGEYGFYSHEKYSIIRNTWGCEITIGKIIREETIIY